MDIPKNFRRIHKKARIRNGIVFFGYMISLEDRDINLNFF